jgi:hypothetical protein
VRADHVGRPDDRRLRSEQLGRGLLAGNLQTAVILWRYLGRVRVGAVGQRCVLVITGLQRRLVRRHAGNVDVPPAAPVEGAGKAADLAREEGADVDRRVEGAAGQRRQIVVAIAGQVRRRREEVAAGLPAVKQRHVVARVDRGLRDIAADERGPADHQDAHQAAFSPASWAEIVSALGNVRPTSVTFFHRRMPSASMTKTDRRRPTPASAMP